MTALKTKQKRSDGRAGNAMQKFNKNNDTERSAVQTSLVEKRERPEGFDQEEDVCGH